MSATTPHTVIVAIIAVAALVAFAVLVLAIVAVAVAEDRAIRRQAWLDGQHLPIPDDGTPCLVFDRQANAYVYESATADSSLNHERNT